MFSKKKYVYLEDISKKSMKYVIYSGITNTLSWLFYFASLKDGETSIVFTIEKLSIVVTILLSVIFSSKFEIFIVFQVKLKGLFLSYIL